MFCIVCLRFAALCQDMKEKHGTETALKAGRDLLAKDAADKEAADQVTAQQHM